MLLAESITIPFIEENSACNASPSSCPLFPLPAIVVTTLVAASTFLIFEFSLSNTYILLSESKAMSVG